MSRSSFAERFGYGIWLRHLVTGAAPSFAEIGREVDRTGPAVSGWTRTEEPPSDFRVHAPLAAFLGLEERWLVHNEGSPPREELWKAWVTERRRAPRIATAFRAAGKKPAAKDRPA